MIDSYNRNHQNFMVFSSAVIKLKLSFKKTQESEWNHIELAYLRMVHDMPIERQHKSRWDEKNIKPNVLHSAHTDTNFKAKHEWQNWAINFCFFFLSLNYNWSNELVMLRTKGFGFSSSAIRPVQFLRIARHSIRFSFKKIPWRSP